MKLPKEFLKSAEKYNYDLSLLQKSRNPHLYIEKNKILSVSGNSGLKIITKSFSQGVKIKLLIKKDIKIKKPIFFCFGILEKRGKQLIFPEITLKENSEARILSHCTFPKAKDIFHKMETEINLEKGAKLFYQEKHYHGENFGTEVLANFKISIGQSAFFENEFILDKGSIGKLKIFLEAVLKKDAFCKITNKIIGKGKKDEVEVYDKISLNGKNSSSLNKLKGAIVKGGKMFFKGETIAGKRAENAKGHIDCQEIIVGKSIAQSIPIVTVKNQKARITHEASIGKINERELETLMTKGLSEKEAIDFIIKGKIR